MQVEELSIDASYGEGGGQILRNAVAMAAICGRAVRLDGIRAKRRNPGLAAQHLTAIRAAAELCEAELAGDDLGSDFLSFRPHRPVRAGDYHFDVSEARQGGSAGSAILVLQTVLVPLAFATGVSHITVIGGTHVPWSPSFDFMAEVWLPALSHLGIEADAELVRSGWYPKGNGEVRVRLAGLGGAARPGLKALEIVERGELVDVSGRAIAASLPSHIAQRMSDRSTALLRDQGVETDIKAERLTSDSPGAGIFLTASYEHIRCGFGAHGKRGVPSEEVAEAAVRSLLEHHRSRAALDTHLADQLILPLVFAPARSCFTCAKATSHLKTAAWLAEKFGLATVAMGETPDGAVLIEIDPIQRAGMHG